MVEDINALIDEVKIVKKQIRVSWMFIYTLSQEAAHS